MKSHSSTSDTNYDDPSGSRAKLISEIIAFLQLFIPPTVARRLAAMILLIAGVPHDRVSEWTGACDRSVRQWKKQMMTGNADSLLTASTGAGRKGKLDDIESEVIEEISSGNYHTQQQIADMIREKFNREVSLMTVSRFLKKTESES